ncbi:anti-anti-sigma factor [Actinacidiphila alni]|uniref:Anti-anti-sigma factor n=1 Tax=Actinacidiphila alni TaxID=380248 RepID=A0A1I2MVX0_9ACTN|nr:STAS domain-containing protein [Actinacidiphila alni]SFF95714.1 anti-anti-sigma factor [Actinacidiphila alni]
MSTSERASRSLPVVTAAGDLDASNLGPLDVELQAAAETASGVILDISAVTFADSTFLNLLIRTHQHTELRIVGLRPPLDRLFHLVGVDTLLRVFPTVAEARVARA